MNLTHNPGRRNTLKALAAGALLGATGTGAWAQSGRPYSLVVPYPAGASTDLVGRLYAQALAKELGETVITENRDGANGTIGAGYVASAPADGRTMLFSVGALMLAQQFMMKDLKVNILRDFTPVVRTSLVQAVLMTSVDSPIKDVNEFVASARRNPGKHTYAFYGELDVLLLAAAANIKLLAIPYKGGTPAMIDIATGTVDVLYGSLTAAMPMLKSGKLKLLAVYADQRLADYPNVPTIKEVVPSYEGSEYQCVLVPAATPKAVVEELYRKSVAALDTQDMHRQFREKGGAVAVLRPDELKELMEADQERIRNATRLAGIAPA